MSVKIFRTPRAHQQLGGRANGDQKRIIAFLRGLEANGCAALSCRPTAVRLPTAGEILLVVGPESGIIPAELNAFTDAGARPVRRGDEVLRTSAAGVDSHRYPLRR